MKTKEELMKMSKYEVFKEVEIASRYYNLVSAVYELKR